MRFCVHCRRLIRLRCVQLDTKISEAVKAAEAACNDGRAEDCATAWDEVEELSAAASHKKDAVCAVVYCADWNEYQLALHAAFPLTFKVAARLSHLRLRKNRFCVCAGPRGSSGEVLRGGARCR